MQINIPNTVGLKDVKDLAIPVGATTFISGFIPYCSGFYCAGIGKGTLAAYWQSIGFLDPYTFSFLQSCGATAVFP